MRNSIVVIQILALMLCAAPAPALAAGPGARLEGLLIGVDGQPAAGHRVHLIDERGEAIARADVAENGLYAFGELPAGDYALGIESPDGSVAPVAAPPVRLGERELARRDLKLMEADPAAVDQAVRTNKGFKIWWHGLSKAGKAWTVLAVVFAGALTWEALDNEGEGSQFEPGG